MSVAGLAPFARVLRSTADACGAAAAGLTNLQRATRFLSERTVFVARPDDVIISSYPRSGTTWLQLMTHLVLRGGGLDFRHINEVVPWYERALALGRQTAADFNAMLGPRAFKSHLPYAWLPTQGRLIYVCRDVHDVALSYYGLYRSHLGYSGNLSEFVARFVRGQLQYRSWYEHVAHWELWRTSPRVLWLRYEDMQADPRAALSCLVSFLGVTLSCARFEEVHALCSLESMKREEARFDHGAEERYQLGMQPGKFLGQRSASQGHLRLSAEDYDLLNAPKTRATLSHPRWADLPAFLH